MGATRGAALVLGGLGDDVLRAAHEDGEHERRRPHRREHRREQRRESLLRLFLACERGDEAREALDECDAQSTREALVAHRRLAHGEQRVHSLHLAEVFLRVHTERAEGDGGVLARLVDEGLMEKVEYQQNPVRHEYVLTEKGRAASDVLIAMWRYGEDHFWPERERPPLELAFRESRATVRAAVVDEVFSVLMGEDVESRKNFIQTNAKDVRFLDI